MRTNSRSLVTVALVIVFFLSAHTPSALAAQAKPLTKVVVGYGSTDGGVAILGFARETRLFEKHGLDVVLVGMGTGSVSLRALIAKDLEIASLSGSGLVQAALQGADTVLIAALINGFVFKIFSAPEITNPAQLKGKKLGVSRYGATSDFAVRLALKKWGLNPDRDVSILQVGTSQDTVRAMQAKMLDAGVLSGTSSLIARKAGFRELGDLADLGLNYPTSSIGTTKSYLQKNEEIVKEFMLAYIEAIHDFKRNKEAALAVLKKYTRNDDREVLEDAYSNVANKYLPLPIPTIDGIRTILTELSSTLPAAKTADPEQFVSYKIMREIEASGFVKRLYEK
jgi:ABC-type nitrate/sulfonate/bicarbonate transport system substrate-binding protein